MGAGFRGQKGGRLSPGICRRARRAMSAKGHTFASLARAMGTSAASVHRIVQEENIMNAKLGTLVRLCDALEVPIDWLLMGASAGARPPRFEF